MIRRQVAERYAGLTETVFGWPSLIVTVWYFPDALVERAEAEAKRIGKLCNSIRKGGGNLIGCVGDELIAEYLGGRVFHTDDYDVLLPDGYKVECKSKETTVTPRESDEASVALSNTRQKCNAYAFARVLNDLTTAWLCGWITRDLFFKRSRLLKKGQIDGSNRFRVRDDCRNAYHYSLNPLWAPPRGEMNSAVTGAAHRKEAYRAERRAQLFDHEF